MTDEERAEEYAKGKAHEHYHFLFEENNGSPVDFAKLCHLDGLVEGRKLGKEEQWKATEKAQKKTSARIRELKKENEELKRQLEKTNENCAKEIINDIGIVSQRNLKIEQLEKENEELKKRCSDYAMQLKRFLKDEELSFLNCNPRSRLEILKENEELKETVSRSGYRIAELKHEIDELKEKLKGFESGDVAWQGDMDETIKQNLELKNEIEELKALHESDKKATALLMQKWEEERNELKAHCKAVDEVNEKMKCCGNCKKERNKPEPLSVHISCAKITANGS